MNKRYRLGEIEEAVSEMEELIDTQDDIAEIDDDFQIVVSGWPFDIHRPAAYDYLKVIINLSNIILDVN